MEVKGRFGPPTGQIVENNYGRNTYRVQNHAPTHCNFATYLYTKSLIQFLKMSQRYWYVLNLQIQVLVWDHHAILPQRDKRKDILASTVRYLSALICSEMMNKLLRKVEMRARHLLPSMIMEQSCRHLLPVHFGDWDIIYHDSPAPFWATMAEKAYKVFAIRVQRVRPRWYYQLFAQLCTKPTILLSGVCVVFSVQHDSRILRQLETRFSAVHDYTLCCQLNSQGCQTSCNHPTILGRRISWIFEELAALDIGLTVPP